MFNITKNLEVEEQNDSKRKIENVFMQLSRVNIVLIAMVLMYYSHHTNNYKYFLGLGFISSPEALAQDELL